VVVCGDYNSAKLLNVEEVDWIADGPGLRVYHQTVLVLVHGIAQLIECRYRSGGQ
jgi:hypothetical protein